MRHDLHQSGARRGFTLLEVMVAVAILGLGLTAILSAQAGAMAAASHARHVNLGTGFLRCKMLDLEAHLLTDGFQDLDEAGDGPCCDTDEIPGIVCSWTIEKPVMPTAQLGDLNIDSALGGSGSGGLGALGLLAGGQGTSSSFLPGGGGSVGNLTDIANQLAGANQGMAPPPGGGMNGPDPSTLDGGIGLSGSTGSGVPTSTDAPPGGGALDGIAQMAMSFVYPNLKSVFEASARRVTVTVTWKEGFRSYSMALEQWVTQPQPGLPTDDDPDASSTSTGTSGGPAPRKPTPPGRGTSTGTGGVRGGGRGGR